MLSYCCILHEDQLKQTDLYKNFDTSKDLLYGLQSHRKFITPLFQGTGPIVIDKVNNKIILTLVAEHGYQAEEEKALHEEHKESYISQYLTFFTSAAVPHKVRINRNEYNSTIRSNEDTVIKRCCQAALLKPDVNKHFMLDGINLQDVFEPTGDQYNSFTSAEIRFVFKNWDRIKNTITFYSNGKKIKNFFEHLNSHSALNTFKTYLETKQIEPESINFDQLTIANWNLHQTVKDEYKTPSPIKIRLSRLPSHRQKFKNPVNRKKCRKAIISQRSPRNPNHVINIKLKNLSAPDDFLNDSDDSFLSSPSPQKRN